jgi:hypothetical protein
MINQYEIWKQQQEQTELQELDQLRIENERLQARIRMLVTILEKAGQFMIWVEVPEYREKSE